MDVFKIASINSARLVGAGHYLGSITEGKLADVVLINGDPTQDMSKIREISLVVKGNYFYKPDELYKALGVAPFTVSSQFQ